MAQSFTVFSDLSICPSNLKPHVVTPQRKRARSISPQQPHQSSHSHYETNLTKLQTTLLEMKNDLYRRKIKIVKKTNIFAIIFYDRDEDLRKHSDISTQSLSISPSIFSLKQPSENDSQISGESDVDSIQGPVCVNIIGEASNPKTHLSPDENDISAILINLSTSACNNLL